MELTGHLLLPKDISISSGSSSSSSNSNGNNPNTATTAGPSSSPDDDCVPPDPGSFVLDLQRSVPLDLFDTSELFLQQ